MIIPFVPLPSSEKVLLPPKARKLSVLPPCNMTGLAVPSVIFESSPSSMILPSPKLIDASCELISMLFASTDNFCVAISTSVSNLKCPTLPTKLTRGLDTELTYPRNIPVFSNPAVDCPILKKGFVFLPLANHCLFVPNDIDASVEDNSNPLEVTFNSVTLISTSVPVILNEPPSNFT